MVSYKTIYQTDKNRSTLGEESQAWADMNRPDGWELRFLSDKNAQEWVEDKFKGSEVEWAWDYMHRGVLRADFLRYLLPLIRGGVYTDVDVSYPPGKLAPLKCEREAERDGHRWSCYGGRAESSRLAHSGQSNNGVSSTLNT